jgi:type 1 glutamine amidotransferase
VRGDEEYRSEESLPQLAKILSQRHGFQCTVLFAIDPKDGTINPAVNSNIPGLDALARADLMIISTRWRILPDEQMKHVDAYVQSGKPVLGLRTATHAFRFPKDAVTGYRQYDSGSKEWDGGFGRQVLGETWISHHGHHAVQSTRGVIVDSMKKHPILRGVEDIWGPTDVYTVTLPLPGDSQPLVLGQVLEGMKPEDKPVVGKYAMGPPNRRVEKTPNDPMMPVAWTKTYAGKNGKGRVFTTTMGAAVDLQSEGLRRMVVNAVYWCLGMEKKIPAKSDVRIVGVFEPTFFGFNKHVPGKKPADYK